MSDAMVQEGESLQIAFGSFAYTGYIPEDGLVWSKPREVEEVYDENNSIVTLIISRPRDQFDVSLIIKTTSGDITPPVAGTEVTITDPDGTSVKPRWVSDPQVTFARSYAKLSGTMVLYPDIAAEA